MAKYWNSGKDCFESIPEAPYYVLSNDSFMSGWGKAADRVKRSPMAPGLTLCTRQRTINTCVVPCTSLVMAIAVEAYVQTRTEQKYVRIVGNRPRSKAHVIYSLQSGWIDRAREHSNVRAEYKVTNVVKVFQIGYGSALNFLRAGIWPALDGYLQVKTAARILLTTPNTLYKRIRRGEVAYIYIDGVIHIKVSTILEMCQARFIQ